MATFLAVMPGRIVALHVAKGDTVSDQYLNVPTPLAVDGEWPLGFGEAAGGQLAGEGQPNHWPGFHRRWAVGLKLERSEAN